MVEVTWLRFDIEGADIRPGSEIGPYGFLPTTLIVEQPKNSLTESLESLYAAYDMWNLSGIQNIKTPLFRGSPMSLFSENC